MWPASRHTRIRVYYYYNECKEPWIVIIKCYCANKNSTWGLLKFTFVVLVFWHWLKCPFFKLWLDITFSCHPDIYGTFCRQSNSFKTLFVVLLSLFVYITNFYWCCWRDGLLAFLCKRRIQEALEVFFIHIMCINMIHFKYHGYW